MKEIVIQFHPNTQGQHPLRRGLISRLEISETVEPTNAIDSAIARFKPDVATLFKDECGVHLETGDNQFTFPWSMISVCKNVPRRIENASQVESAGTGAVGKGPAGSPRVRGRNQQKAASQVAGAEKEEGA